MKSSTDNNIPHIEHAGKGIFVFGKEAYLDGAKAVVTFTDKNYFAPADADPKDITIKNKSYKYVLWGANDDYPNQIAKAVYANPILARGTEFNIVSIFGKGVKPVRKTENGSEELPADHEVSLFFQDNDIANWYLEQATDMQLNFTAFNNIVLNIPGDKILKLNHLETMFSRLEEPDKLTGRINNHFYCAKFGTEKTIEDGDIDVTPCLNNKFTYAELLTRVGKNPEITKNKDSKERSFVLPVKFPTPGRVVYSKPYWHSILTSGWLDFANKIPEFKKALMTNQITVKYRIVISEDYFTLLFANENITSDEAKKARVLLEYKNFNEFLTDTKNTAKSFVTYSHKYLGNKGGYEYKDQVDFIPVKNEFKGGEFIEDSEEANNIISYAIGVHPLITGASPGKNGSISGTEARELFNLKRALIFPYRMNILSILYLIKRFNNWDPDIFFAVDDVALTTLDNDKTGMQVIRNIY